MEKIKYLNRLVIYLVDKMIQGNFSSFEMIKRNMDLEQVSYSNFDRSMVQSNDSIYRDVFVNLYSQNEIYLNKKLSVAK